MCVLSTCNILCFLTNVTSSSSLSGQGKKKMTSSIFVATYHSPLSGLVGHINTRQIIHGKWENLAWEGSLTCFVSACMIVRSNPLFWISSALWTQDNGWLHSNGIFDFFWIKKKISQMSDALRCDEIYSFVFIFWLSPLYWDNPTSIPPQNK